MTLTATEQARRGELDSVLADQARIDDQTPAELFAFVDALDAQSALKRALTDPATPAEARQRMAERLLQGKVGGQTVWIVSQAVQYRWNSGAALADALERQAVRATLRQAEAGDRVDEVTGQLHEFELAVQGDASLRAALSNTARELSDRQELVARLLGGKVNPWTLQLATRAVAGRQRNFELTVEDYLQVAAELRNRNLARVTVARPMDEEQAERLRRALSRLNGRVVDMEISIDPAVMGGVRVELGDEVIEGTVSDRLEQVHRQLS